MNVRDPPEVGHGLKWLLGQSCKRGYAIIPFEIPRHGFLGMTCMGIAKRISTPLLGLEGTGSRRI